MHDVIGRNTAEHAIAYGDKHLAGVHHRAELNALVGAAILLCHDTVLRNVDEAAG